MVNRTVLCALLGRGGVMRVRIHGSAFRVSGAKYTKRKKRLAITQHSADGIALTGFMLTLWAEMPNPSAEALVFPISSFIVSVFARSRWLCQRSCGVNNGDIGLVLAGWLNELSH